MEKVLSILAKAVLVLLMSLLLQGCDFFRVLAGKPTGKDLAELAAYRQASLDAAEAERLERQADSLELVRLREQWVEDSVCVRQAMDGRIADFKKTSELTTRPAEWPDCRFCLMVGYFGNRGNAERLCSKIEADGHEPFMIEYENGATGVALFPSSSAFEILSRIDSVRTRDYLPSDFWIIWNTDKYNQSNNNIQTK